VKKNTARTQRTRTLRGLIIARGPEWHRGRLFAVCDRQKK
jgi:hypothetical protein